MLDGTLDLPAARRIAGPAAALTVTLVLAAVGWVLSIRQMGGMDMGPATGLGSLAFFAGLWMAMTAAMMLPGVGPAVVRRVRLGAPISAVTRWLMSYLAVWAVVGIAVYAGYRPHGTVAAAAVVIAAGAYELTPLKRHFRHRCRADIGSGFGYGLCCVGSGLGLMLMVVALGIMSLTWMSVVAAVVLLQKLLPPRRAVDVLVALVIVAFGVWILFAPASVPALTTMM